jgi:hypothetical protein
VYNRPGPRFRAANTVLVIVASTALFHAMFYEKSGKPLVSEKSGKEPALRMAVWDKARIIIALSLQGCAAGKCQY